MASSEHTARVTTVILLVIQIVTVRASTRLVGSEMTSTPNDPQNVCLFE
jgi:hypothetical protein